MKFLITFSKSIGFLACLFLGFSPAFSQSLVAIPNPDGHILASDLREDDVPFFFDGKLLVRLSVRVPHGYVYKLALFDGQNYSIVENPDNGKGYMSCPVIFNNNLYVKYELSTGYHVLAKLTGNRLVIVPNPAGYTYYSGFPFVYKNKLYLRYNINSTPYSAYFDGNTITIDNNGYNNIVYKDKMYFLRGSNVIQRDSSRDIVFFETSNMIYNFIIHNDTLFMTTIAGDKLFKTDGIRVQEITTPRITSSSLPLVSISLGSKLYIFYSATLPGQTKLLEYSNGSTQLINNLDNGMGIDVTSSKPVVFRDTLFFHYLGNNVNNSNYHLAKLNGNNISFVGASMNHLTYYTYPIVFNQNIYYHGGLIPNQPFKLLRYNGYRITPISAPDSLGLVPGMPIIFNNKLYAKAFRHLAVLEQEGGSVATQNIVTDNIKIFPNPANQLLNVILEDGQIGKIDIFNLLGQKVLTKNLLEQNNQLGIESLSSGTYLVNILIGEKTVHKTFIKQ